VAVAPHVHIGAVSLLASTAAVIAVFGTLHLLALTSDTPAARAWIALGF
jgi:predicted exporter